MVWGRYVILSMHPEFPTVVADHNPLDIVLRKGVTHTSQDAVRPGLGLGSTKPFWSGTSKLGTNSMESVFSFLNEHPKLVPAKPAGPPTTFGALKKRISCSRLLLGSGSLEVIRGLFLDHGDAQGQLQEFGGLQAIAAGIALGLQCGFPLGETTISRMRMLMSPFEWFFDSR